MYSVTSVKLFMTYAALQLRDHELLDVMYEARKLHITTVSLGRLPDAVRLLIGR